MNEKKLQKYAELIVRTGVNVQPGQPLQINCPVEIAYFARHLVKAAYEAGASKVTVDWLDGEITKMNYVYRTIESLTTIPHWQIEKAEEAMDQNTARISISASNPELLKEVDPNKIKQTSIANQKALKNVQSALMANKVQWCVVSIPTIDWAKKVFPGVSEEEAVSKLWDAIYTSVRITDDNDPVNAWAEHNATLDKKCKVLNDHNFDYFEYKSANGTDFTIKLATDHVWCGGHEKAQNNVIFNPNMPTEEVFSMPYKTGVNGKVVATKPLNYSGQLIENFNLTFKDGKVVEFHAEKGEAALRSLVELDEGSCYLGEVALVPYASPISESGILFYNTLFDENASCHLALGKAYPMNIKNGTEMEQAELAKKGANDSLTHVDFMIGAKDLSIVGVDHKGNRVQIFKDGNWAI